MADNLTTQSATPATIPASTVIATDDAGAAGHVQVVKLAVSTDGDATPLTADNTNGLLVNLGTNNDVTVTGTVTAQDGGGSLTIDGTVAVSSVAGTVAVTDNAGSLTVDNAALSVTGGGVEASALRVTLASDSTGVLSVDDNGGSLTVDGTVAVSGTVAVTDNLGSLTIDNAALSVTGGGVEASALRVTLASDSTGLVSVDDNGGSLTVDGTVTVGSITAGNNVIGQVKITDGTDVALVDASGNLMVNVAAGGAGDGSILDGVSSAIKATVLDYTNSNPLAVRLTDTNGDYVGAGAGTQYTEDAAAAADPVGTMAMAVRADTPAAVTTTDGDNIALRATNKGELYVKQSDAVSVTGTVTAQDGGGSLTVDGTVAVSSVGGTVAVTDNAGSLTVDGTVAVSSVGGTVAVTDNSGSLTVDGSVTANAGTNLNTSALALESGGNLAAAATSLGLLDNAVSGNSIVVTAPAVQDTGNSTTTPLGSSGNFTGSAFDLNGYASWSVNIYSDKASATNGMVVQWSDNGTNWDFSDIQTYNAAVGNMITFGRKARYVRLNYTNTNSAQTTFRVTAYGQPLAVRQTRKFVGNALADQETAQVVIAAIQGHTTAGGGSWVDVKVNPSGALSADVTNAGTFAVQVNGAALTSLQLIDDGVATVASAIPTKGMAAAGTDGTNARILKTDTSGELQVDVLTLPNVTVGAALPAGTNAIGKLAANDGVDIGDVTINNAAGASAVNIQDGGNSITVDNGGTFVVQATIAAGATNIAKAEDAASADADVGVPAMAVRKATPANTSGLDGDYEMLQMSAGRLWTSATIDAALPAGTNAIGKLAANSGVTIGAVEIASAQTLGTVTTVTTLTGGGIAHDSPDSGNPVKVGAKASATLSDDTMVANADRTDLTADLDGALYVRNVPLGDLIFEAVSDTGGTSTAFTNFGATASTRSYITSVTAFRTDSGTTMAYIDFRDGTAGSVIYRIPLPPSGGVTISNAGAPLFYTTANTALAYDVSAALTTVYISVTGFKSKARA